MKLCRNKFYRDAGNNTILMKNILPAMTTFLSVFFRI